MAGKNMEVFGAATLNAVQSYLTCSICQDLFRDPRNMPCGHTFCLVCLQEMEISAKQSSPAMSDIRCPICRAVYSFKSHSVQSLPKIYAIDHLLQEAGSMAVDARRAGSGARSGLSYCSVHANFEATIYCTQCVQMGCNTCAGTRHKHHTFTELTSADVEFTAHLESVLQSLRLTNDRHEREIETLSASIASNGKSVADTQFFLARTRNDLEKLFDEQIRHFDTFQNTTLQIVSMQQERQVFELIQQIEVRKIAMNGIKQKMELLMEKLSPSSSVSDRFAYIHSQLLPNAESQCEDNVAPLQADATVSQAVFAKWKSDVNEWCGVITDMLSNAGTNIPQLNMESHTTQRSQRREILPPQHLPLANRDKLSQPPMTAATVSPKFSQPPIPQLAQSSEFTALHSPSKLPTTPVSPRPPTITTSSTLPRSPTTTPKSPQLPTTTPASPQLPTTTPTSPQPLLTTFTSPQPLLTTPTSPQPPTTTPTSPQPLVTTPTSPQPLLTTFTSPQPPTTTPTSPQALVTTLTLPQPPNHEAVFSASATLPNQVQPISPNQRVATLPRQQPHRMPDIVTAVQHVHDLAVSELRGTDNYTDVVSLSSTGQLMVGEWNSNSLYIYDGSTDLTLFRLPAKERLFSAAWTHQGNVVCTTESRKVIVLSRSGDVQVQTRRMTHPLHVSVSEDGDIYVADWDSGVYQSTDNGTTWNHMFAPDVKGWKCIQVVKVRSPSGGRNGINLFWVLEQKNEGGKSNNSSNSTSFSEHGNISRLRAYLISGEKRKYVVATDVSIPANTAINFQRCRLAYDGHQHVYMTDWNNKAVHVFSVNDHCYSYQLLSSQHFVRGNNDGPVCLAVNKQGTDSTTFYVGQHNGVVGVYKLAETNHSNV